MKRSLLLSALLGGLLSAQAQKPFDFEIRGTLSGLGDDTIHLTRQDGKGGLSRDAIPVKADNFRYTGSASKVDMAYLTMPRNRRMGDISLFIEAGVIRVDADVSDPGRARVGGTRANEDQNRIRSLEQPFYDGIMALRNELKSRTDTGSAAYRDIPRRIDSLQSAVMQVRESWARENPTSFASATCLWVLADRIPFERLDRLYGALSPEVRSTSLMQRLGVKVEGKRRSLAGRRPTSTRLTPPVAGCA